MENSSSTSTVSITNASHSVPFHPLRNPLILDEYESGMEASVSSMASGGDDDDDDDYEDDDDNFEQRTTGQRQVFNANKLNITHRRMSSGSVSTDSNTATNSPKVIKKRPYYLYQQRAPLNSFSASVNSRIQSSFSKRDEMIRTPNSGYDGDTEGPANEDTASTPTYQ